MVTLALGRLRIPGRSKWTLTLCAVAGLSCDWEPQAPVNSSPTEPSTTSSVSAIWPGRAANGVAITEEDARTKLRELTRLVALAMQDGTIRALVYNSMRTSRYPEGKLGFRRFTDGPGNPLLEVMASKSDRGFNRETLARFRDSGVELELYLPVAEHRTRWQGGNDLIVATSLKDHEPPIAFDLQGNEITGLSSETPPTVPTLALVPVETDFDQPPGAELALTAGTAPTGIYLRHVNLSDTGEGFLRGSPEIEAMLMGPITDTMTLAKIDCANESRTGPRFYNQDDNDWSGNVLLADSLQLASIKSKYPAGTPWSNVRFTIEFWEDDTERCVIATDVNTWKNLVKATILTVVGGLAWISTDLSEPIDDEAWPFLAQLPLGTLALIQTIGANDDNLGYVVNKAAWNPKHPSDLVTENHAVMLGNSRTGRATLVWTFAAPPPAPFTVTANAPGSVTAKGTYALTGAANYPASGWRWERSDNGGTTWTTWATTQNSSFFVSAGQEMTIQWRLFARRNSDSVTDFGFASTFVCTVSGGCGPIL